MLIDCIISVCGFSFKKEITGKFYIFLFKKKRIVSNTVINQHFRQINIFELFMIEHRNSLITFSIIRYSIYLPRKIVLFVSSMFF